MLPWATGFVSLLSNDFRCLYTSRIAAFFPNDASKQEGRVFLKMDASTFVFRSVTLIEELPSFHDERAVLVSLQIGRLVAK